MDDLINNKQELLEAQSAIGMRDIVEKLVMQQRRLLFLCMILSIGLVVVSIVAGVGYFRRPKVLVAVQTEDGRRITQIDDVSYGGNEAVQMGEDKLTNEDKKYVVNSFLEKLYTVDMASRSKDIPAMLAMMTSNEAAQYYKQLNESGYLQKERDESWAAAWSVESIEVDQRDPNQLTVIGTQKIRKNLGGNFREEKVQFKIGVEVYSNGKRDETPLRSGYFVRKFEAHEINRTAV